MSVFTGNTIIETKSYQDENESKGSIKSWPYSIDSSILLRLTVVLISYFSTKHIAYSSDSFFVWISVIC